MAMLPIRVHDAPRHAPSALVRSGSGRRRAERSVTDALIVRSEFCLTHLVSLVDGSRHGLQYPLALPPPPSPFTRPTQHAATDNPQTFTLAPLPFACALLSSHPRRLLACKGTRSTHTGALPSADGLPFACALLSSHPLSPLPPATARHARTRVRPHPHARARSASCPSLVRCEETCSASSAEY